MNRDLSFRTLIVRYVLLFYSRFQFLLMINLLFITFIVSVVALMEKLFETFQVNWRLRRRLE